VLGLVVRGAFVRPCVVNAGEVTRPRIASKTPDLCWTAGGVSRVPKAPPHGNRNAPCPTAK